MNLQRVTRLRYIYNGYLRTRRCNYSCQNRHSIYNFINNFELIPQICSYHSTVSCINTYSTSAISEEFVDVNVFEKVCEETLESLTDFFEELVENKDLLKNADVSYSVRISFLLVFNIY